MQQTLDIVLPVFGILAVGYAFAKARILGESVADGLTAYIYNVAMPLLLFRSMATARMPETFPIEYLAAYFAPAAIVWTLSTVIASKILRLPAPESAIAGLASAYSNTMMLGLPLVLITYGDAGQVPLFILLSVHLPLMTVACAVHLEIVQGGGRVADVARRSLTGLIIHPIIIGVFAGLAWRLTGIGVPAAADAVVKTIADTGIACALFAMGLTLSRYSIRGALRPASVITVLKLVAMPALVWTTGTYVIGLDPVWTGVLTIFAAAPVGINPFIFASRYKAGVPMVSSAIALSTALSVVTVTTILFWLTRG